MGCTNSMSAAGHSTREGTAMRNPREVSRCSNNIASVSSSQEGGSPTQSDDDEEEGADTEDLSVTIATLTDLRSNDSLNSEFGGLGGEVENQQGGTGDELQQVRPASSKNPLKPKGSGSLPSPSQGRFQVEEPAPNERVIFVELPAVTALSQSHTTEPSGDDSEATDTAITYCVEPARAEHASPKDLFLFNNQCKIPSPHRQPEQQQHSMMINHHSAQGLFAEEEYDDPLNGAGRPPSVPPGNPDGSNASGSWASKSQEQVSRGWESLGGATVSQDSNPLFWMDYFPDSSRAVAAAACNAAPTSFGSHASLPTNEQVQRPRLMRTVQQWQCDIAEPAAPASSAPYPQGVTA